MEKVLVIVAHPDDETIWAGGTLLENDWNLTIISLCRKDDLDRAPRFQKACEEYRAKCIMSDLEDQNLLPLDSKEIIRRIKEFADDEYDVIITHGKNGEYGHIRHKEVHNAVVEMLDQKLIKAGKIFFFSYTKKGRYAYPNRNSDKFIYLKPEIFVRKKDLIQNVYGFKKNGFEERCCRNAESFKMNL